MQTEHLVHRQVYKIVSRNLNVGVWDDDESWFVGIRYKFGLFFLESEDDTVADAKPYDPPIMVPGEISLDGDSGALLILLTPLNEQAERGRQ